MMRLKVSEVIRSSDIQLDEILSVKIRCSTKTFVKASPWVPLKATWLTSFHTLLPLGRKSDITTIFRKLKFTFVKFPLNSLSAQQNHRLLLGDVRKKLGHYNHNKNLVLSNELIKVELPP